MKKLKLLGVCLFLFTLQILPQDWPIAPEVWSEPVLLDPVFNKPYKWLDSPALTANMDTMYLSMGEGIFRSVKLNNKWLEPVKLNENINTGGAATQRCSISKDGKRLYFSGWGGYGSWDLWYSDWSNTLNDWAPAINMGPVINSTFVDSYLYAVSSDTVYTISGLGFIDLFYLNNVSNNWVMADSFWYHPIGGALMSGMSLTKNKQKMYFASNRLNEDWGVDLCVVYWDTLINYWGNVYYLNINTKKIKINNLWRRGMENYPWISRDGKIMVFSSNRNVSLHPDSSNTTSIFISYLLIDENGDTVTSVIKNENSLLKVFSLEQNYPNPFNPSTTIKYTIKENGNIKLVIYDAIGKKIAELINEYKNKGEYKIQFDTLKYNLVSGVYYYQLIHNNNYTVKKMIFAK
ncbi:MAG: T9SS type A sorting domain-containing protein [bacterium]